MNKYLVGIPDMELRDCEMFIVNANSKEEAIDKYISNVSINNQYFLNSVYDTARNMSYAEGLYIDENGIYLYDDYGNPRYSYEEIEEYFINNVRKLFKDNDEWYNLYLKLVNEEEVVFPKEMLIHMYKSSVYSNDDNILCKKIGEDIPEIV